MHLNRLFVRFLIVGLTFLLVSCESKQKPSTNGSFKKWQTGKLYADIKVQSDPTLSYALYLPKLYNENKENLIFFVFDAHARGVLPVEKYQLLAEKYNLIIAASNNSENGQSAQERNRIITGFMGDVEKQFHIDRKRIYTAGFSGGARIATLVALYNSNVAGVIGCSAGFPQVQNPVNKSFTWVGVVGNRDFNYLELKNLNRQLRANRWKSHLLIFDGKHEWPPVEVMDEAIQVLLEKKNGLARFEVEDKPENRKFEKEETRQQKVLVRAMEEKDLNWWRIKIDELNKPDRISGTSDELLMNQRLISYLSMISYIYTERALKAGQTDKVAKYLAIYKNADPDNPDVYFFEAVRFAMLKQDKETIDALQKAKEKGFDDFSKIEKFKSFDYLKENVDFKTIVGR